MANKNFLMRKTLFGFPILHPINLIFITNAIIHILQIIFRYYSDSQIVVSSANFLGLEPIPISSRLLDSEQFSYYFSIVPSLGLQPISFLRDTKLWQVFTYGFLHSTDGIQLHFIFNMYALFLTARFLIPIMGTLHFTFLYLTSLVGAGIIVVAYSYGVFILKGDLHVLAVSTVGASGGLFGLLAILGIMYPNLEFYFFPIPIPIKAQYIVLISIVIGIVLSYAFQFPISNVGHIGGALCGYLYYSLFMKKLQMPFALGKFIIKKKENNPEEVIDSQINANKKILQKLNDLSLAEKEEFLKPLQVENANICPPNVFNTEDPFCLRCEWLVNCSLRKIKSKE